MERKSLGDRLKRLRKDERLTQQEFARLLSVSSSYISEVEAGNKQAGLDLLLSLKKNLKVNIDWLLTGEQDQPQFVAEAAPIYHSGDIDLREICEWLKENPGDKKLILKVVKAKKGLKEAMDDLAGVKGLVEE